MIFVPSDLLLIPKIGTWKRLTCGPSLVRKHHSAGSFLKAFGKDTCGLEHAIIRQKGCFAFGRGSIWEYVMTWPEYKEGTNWWRVQDGHWRRGINLGSKSCNRDRRGVALGRGYKYEPLVFVIGIEQFHNKPAPCHLSNPLVKSSSSSRGIIDPLTFVSTDNLVSCLVSCGGFRPWCKWSCYHAYYHAVDLSLVQEGFLLDHEPCGRLRSSLELVISSIRFGKI
jgi:hypothetical protein